MGGEDDFGPSMKALQREFPGEASLEIIPSTGCVTRSPTREMVQVWTDIP